MCSLVFPVFCFQFCTEHLGIDRAHWPVHFYAVPALCRDLHPWSCDGFSINPCCFLQQWKLPYCTDKGNWPMCCPRWLFEIKHWPKKVKTKWNNNKTKTKQQQARGLFSVFRLQSVITGRKYLIISPVEDVASFPQVPDLQDSREVRNSFCYRSAYCCQTLRQIGRDGVRAHSAFEITQGMGSSSPLYLTSVGLVGLVAGLCVGFQTSLALWLIQFSRNWSTDHRGVRLTGFSTPCSTCFLT